jgi:hypothetical protein
MCQEIFRKHLIENLTSRTHHWKETYRHEVMKLQAFFLLHLLQKPDELFVIEENSGNTRIFGPVQ